MDLLPFLFLLLILIPVTTAQPSFLEHYCIDTTGNFTASSVYHTNLNTLLSNLSSNTQIDYGFYNFSYGQNSDEVNAIGLCRGDVKPEACLSCLNNSRILLIQLCPNQKEGIGWYDECMLRYSSGSIFGIMESKPLYSQGNSTNATYMDLFNQNLRDLLDSLMNNITVLGDSRRKFAANKINAPRFQTIFAHVQCTPDLSKQACSKCLVEHVSNMPNCCEGRITGRLGNPSCNIRFDTTLYYDPTFAVPLPVTPQAFPSPPPSITTTFNEGKSNSRRFAIGIIVLMASFIFIVLPISFMCIYLRKRKPRKKNLEGESEVDHGIEPIETLQLDFQTIIDATNNFSDANKLGQGGFGPVYKAWRNWREGTALNIVDPTLNNNSRNEIMRCIHIGLLGVQEDVAKRPTMATVVVMLNSHSLTLPEPLQPAYFMNARGPSETRLGGSRSNSIQASANEASISELDPR